MIAFYFLTSIVLAQPVAKWEYAFSPRVQMMVNDTHFYFLRCDLDVCRRLSENLPKPIESQYQEIISLTRQFEKRSQYIVDALSNYKSMPQKYPQVTHGTSISPDIFEVECGSPEITKFIKDLVDRKVKDKNAYVFKYQGASNKFCRSGRAGETVRSIDEVEPDIKALVSGYKQAYKALTVPSQ